MHLDFVGNSAKQRIGDDNTVRFRTEAELACGLVRVVVAGQMRGRDLGLLWALFGCNESRELDPPPPEAGNYCTKKLRFWMVAENAGCRLIPKTVIKLGKLLGKYCIWCVRKCYQHYFPVLYNCNYNKLTNVISHRAVAVS